MLIKALKHDFRALWRAFILISMISTLSSVIGGLSFYALNFSFGDEVVNKVLSGSFTLLGVASIVAMVVCYFVIMLMTYLRFYRSLYTDEGYLTFTLPVSRGAILFSKTVTGVFASIYATVVVVVDTFIFTILSMLNEILNSTGGSSGPTETVDIELGWIFGYIAVIAVVVFISLVLTVTLVHLSITLGAVLVKRAKLIIGIAFYYGITTALQLIGQVVMIFVAYVFGADIISFLMTLSGFALHGTIYAAILGYGVALIAYLCTLKIMKRRLNLP